MSVPIRRLQPLRLPQGWAVLYNQFLDVEPRFKTHDDVSWDFGEDILLMENTDAVVMVALGWYPSHRSTGRFSLVVAELRDGDNGTRGADWDKPLRELQTRSKRKLVATLEDWVDWYSNRELVEEPKARLRRWRRSRPRGQAIEPVLAQARPKRRGPGRFP